MIIVYILIWSMHPMEPGIMTKATTAAQCEQLARHIEYRGGQVRARCLRVLMDAQR